MKFVRVNEAEQFQLQSTVFEEVIRDFRSDECRDCLVAFSNKLHAKMFSKGKKETTQRVRETMREVFGIGARV